MQVPPPNPIPAPGDVDHARTHTHTHTSAHTLASQDMERDADSSRLGSEGFIAERIDEKLPYIDQGYVDEDSDFLGKLFGKKGKK